MHIVTRFEEYRMGISSGTQADFNWVTPLPVATGGAFRRNIPSVNRKSTFVAWVTARGKTNSNRLPEFKYILRTYLYNVWKVLFVLEPQYVHNYFLIRYVKQ